MDSTPEIRERAATRVRIARDWIAEFQTDLIEADVIDTETAVRTFERSSFASGGQFLRTSADIFSRAAHLVQAMRDNPGEADDLEKELRDLREELEELGKLGESLGSGMKGVADNTMSNAAKEEALKPETTPGGHLGPTVPRPPGGGAGSPPRRRRRRRRRWRWPWSRHR
ncbi:MAG: hypothetical protein ACT4P7_12845 [Gemmatimonadaceae bacterium]